MLIDVLCFKARMISTQISKDMNYLNIWQPTRQGPVLGLDVC